MYSIDPRHVLDAANQRLHLLRAEAARPSGASWTRRVLAMSLRCAADRLDPAPLARWAALGPGALAPAATRLGEQP